MPVPFISYRCLWRSFLPDIDHPDIRLGIVVHIIHAQTRTTDPIHELPYSSRHIPVVGCLIPHLCLVTFQPKKVRILELAYFSGFLILWVLSCVLCSALPTVCFVIWYFRFSHIPFRLSLPFRSVAIRSYSDHFRWCTFRIFLTSFSRFVRCVSCHRKALWVVILLAPLPVWTWPFPSALCHWTLVAKKLFLRCSYLFTSLLIIFLSSLFPHPFCCMR